MIKKRFVTLRKDFLNGHFFIIKHFENWVGSVIGNAILLSPLLF